MAKINAQLLERLQTKLGIGRSRAYALIEQKVRESHLPRHLAAIAVASESGINISKFATADELAEIRQAVRGAAPQPVLLPQAVASASGSSTRKGRAVRSPRASQSRRGTSVFVVHGRDSDARKEFFTFLRALGLKPIEWTQAIKMTKQGSPYVGAILETAFREAVAVVVLLTPDDEARLRPHLRKQKEPNYEVKLTAQARQNVLFEAGMAFGRNPDSTVLVQMGDIRPFSDVGGRHVVHLNGSPESRTELATKLANAGCNVDTSGTDWITAGDLGPRQ